jgi:hypothetical protein
MIGESVVISAHGLSIRQRGRYEPAHLVGCFYCEAIYLAAEIEEWCDEPDGERVTAMCAKCGIDSVISKDQVAELGVKDGEFADLLKQMRSHWF